MQSYSTYVHSKDLDMFLRGYAKKKGGSRFKSYPGPSGRGDVTLCITSRWLADGEWEIEWNPGRCPLMCGSIPVDAVGFMQKIDELGSENKKIQIDGKEVGISMDSFNSLKDFFKSL